MIGDSVGAHFHAPEEWFNPTKLTKVWPVDMIWPVIFLAMMRPRRICYFFILSFLSMRAMMFSNSS